ncbi:MAG: 50S ribosomal protein L29 [Cytophagales bacterium]|nr:50S ribosomal protein L29 [Cytophagales bacterium]MDW8385236.1 50S ribosomal protein L29 [Flammeovirgaceae bacterium]
MKNEDIRKLSDIELKSQIKTLENQLAALRYEHRISPIQNPMQIRHMKRDIARLKTELQARAYRFAIEKAKEGELSYENLHEYSQKGAPLVLSKSKLRKAISKSLENNGKKS